MEQHLYTRTQEGFKTISSTSGVSEELLEKIEHKSLYFLPSELLYDDNTPKPVKYIFYSIEDRFVVGRGIYLGKDSVGRPGNYFFHNFIMNENEFQEIDFNPVKLIKFLEHKKLFYMDVPSKLEKIVLSHNEIAVENPNISQFSEELISHLLYFIFNYSNIPNPLLVRGNDSEIINFLEFLYCITPLRIRKNLFFDTFCYSDNLKVHIKGIPNTNVFQEEISYSLELILTDKSFNTTFSATQPDELQTLIIKMVSNGKIDDLNSFLCLDYFLTEGLWEQFKERFKISSKNVRDYVVVIKPEQLLWYLANNKNDLILFEENQQSLLSFARQEVEKKQNLKKDLEQQLANAINEQKGTNEILHRTEKYLSGLQTEYNNLFPTIKETKSELNKQNLFYWLLIFCIFLMIICSVEHLYFFAVEYLYPFILSNNSGSKLKIVKNFFVGLKDKLELILPIIVPVIVIFFTKRQLKKAKESRNSLILEIQTLEGKSPVIYQQIENEQRVINKIKEQIHARTKNINFLEKQLQDTDEEIKILLTFESLK
ncbi:MAG TPA: hypothetical protein P5150_01725 [Candidatus Ratteibacteria bacterium]|nr:hypothetical protein [Candidatus Ratteibacteria bacterium]